MTKGNRLTPNIMVIDDTPINLKLLGEMLQEQGYHVRTFQRAAAAIASALKNPPDLILLDITMPEMNGFEACTHMKNNNILKDIPVIFISALTETNDKITAFEVGGVDYITKPFEFAEVNARVSTHLRLCQLQGQLAEHNQLLETRVLDQVAEISNAQRSTIVALSKLAESRDDETGGHIERTQIICKLLAKQLQNNPRYAAEIDETFICNIYYSSTLHDIGKVGITDTILLKNGPLTSEEFNVMKSHTIIGAKTMQIVSSTYPNNEFMNLGIAIARYHHEKWDGSGYPEGLAGDEIPLAARIMAVADVYDALRSVRPYKNAFSHEKCIEIILEGSGKHFDSGVVDAFMEVEEQIDAIRKEVQILEESLKYSCVDAI